MQKIRIAHVINKLEGGGAERLLSQLLPALSRDMQIDLILLNQEGQEYLNIFKEYQIRIVVLTKAASVYSPIHAFRLVPQLRKYDIIHVHLFPAQYWVALAKFLSAAKTQLVTTEHNTYNARMKYAVFRPLEQFIYSKYRHIVSISRETEKAITIWLKITRAGNQFSVIPNGVDLQLFKHAKKLNPQQVSPHLSAKNKILIQVARFSEQKDQATSIRALLHLPADYVLVLVGQGRLMEDCKKLALHYGLDSRVLFLGYRQDVPELVKSSLISIVSSHWEGFGLVAVEAMAAGVPVVASDVEGLSAVVEGAGMLFAKGDDKMLAEVILSLSTNQSRQERIVERQLQRAHIFSIEACAAAHLSLYQSLIRSNGSN